MNALSTRDQRREAMRARIALATLLAVAATGCSAAGPLVTVDKLLAQCDAFKGKPVQLVGYLGECGGYDCHLAADKPHWDAFVSAFNNARLLQSHAQQIRAPQSRAPNRADGEKRLHAGLGQLPLSRLYFNCQAHTRPGEERDLRRLRGGYAAETCDRGRRRHRRLR